MNTTKTPGQRFAEQYGSKAVEEMLSAIKWAKKLAMAITVLVMAASFQHQMHFLQAKGTDVFGSLVIPIVIDLMTILCVKVLSAAGMDRLAKKVALGFLLFPVAASSMVNFLGSPNVTVGVIYVIVVCFIAVAEIIKSVIRPDFTSILAEEARVQPAAEIGRKRSKVEQDAINTKTALTRERNRILAMPISALRVEAAEHGIDAQGMRKPELQAIVIRTIELDTVAPVSPAVSVR
jgi:hypothetical protein